MREFTQTGKALLTLFTFGLPLFLLFTSGVPDRWPMLAFDAVALAAACFLLAYWAVRPFPLSLHWSLGAPFAAAGVGLLQILFRTSINPNATGLAVLDWLGLGAFYFLALCLFGIDRKLPSYMAVAATSFPVVYSVYTMVGWFVSQGGKLGTMPDRSHYAAFIELFLPAVFWYFLKSPKRNVHAGVATALALASIFVSASAAGWVVAVVEILAVFLLSHYWDAQERERVEMVRYREITYHRYGKRREIDVPGIVKFAAQSTAGFLSGKTGASFWLMGRGAAVLVIVAAVFAIAPLQESLLNSRLRTLLADKRQPESGASRTSLQMLGAHPLLGSGFDTWAEVYPAYHSYISGEKPTSHAYNDPVEWLADGGVLFMIPLALLVAACVRAAADHPWALGPTGVVIYSLVSDPFREPAIPAFLFLILAAGLTRLRR